MITINCVSFFCTHQADSLDGTGAPQADDEVDGEALDDVTPEAEKVSRGPKWNKQKSIAEACTKWATSMLDVHKECEKVYVAQQSLTQLQGQATPATLKVVETTVIFNTTVFEIFCAWHGDVARSPATPVAKAISYDEVLKRAPTDKKRSLWLEVASEIEQFPSWATLQLYSSQTLAAATNKVELTEKTTQGKEIRKQVLAFVKSVRKSAADLNTKLKKMVEDEVKEEANQKVDDGEAAVAQILQTAVQAGTPVQAVPSQKSPVVLALFSADSVRIPDVPMATLNNKEDFTGVWMSSQLTSLESSSVCPYAVSAGPWFASVSAEPVVSQAFGRFMGDFLGSDEYNSEVGKAQSTLVGLGEMAEALRCIVVGSDEQPVIQLMKGAIATLGNAKQRGHEHTYSNTCVCVCMHVVS